jgi:hypothetical protein
MKVTKLKGDKIKQGTKQKSNKKFKKNAKNRSENFQKKIRFPSFFFIW